MSFDESLKSQLRNVHTYVVTPFQANNLFEVDLDALGRNIEFLIEHGVQVIAVGGGTGEIEALTPAELETITQTALQVVGDRALVIASVPGNLNQAAQLLRRYEQMGVQVVLAMPPLIRSKIPDDLEGVFDYYQLLSEVSGLPLMPYNTQAWPAEFFVRLSEIERIVSVKDPCQQPHEFFKAIKLLGDRFVWIGNKRHDPGVLQFRYQMGMEGFTSGQSNFLPAHELAMHQAGLNKDWPTIIKLQEMAAPLERLRLAHDDASMVKTGMDLVGLAGGKVRPPRRDVPPQARDAIGEVLKRLHVARLR